MSGTPTVALDRTEFAYVATDEDGDTAQLMFTMSVRVNTMPTFGDLSVQEQKFTQNTPIEKVVLPEATGGDGELVYSLAPELPEGLRFDPVIRMLSGTPAVATEEIEYTYTATDADGGCGRTDVCGHGGAPTSFRPSVTLRSRI